MGQNSHVAFICSVINLKVQLSYLLASKTINYWRNIKFFSHVKPSQAASMRNCVFSVMARTSGVATSNENDTEIEFM